MSFILYLDKDFQTTIKEEKTNSYVDNRLITSPISVDNIDQPLLIILDDDDTSIEDEHELTNIIPDEIKLEENLSNNEQDIKESTQGSILSSKHIELP